MFTVDDPLLALILRFVVDTEAPEATDAEFLERQLKAMRQYLAQFPPGEHGERAMDWIAEHANRYRRDWERNTLASRTVYLRCADCPLADLGASAQCEIHEQWLYLLHRYLTDQVTSREYIESTLALLQEYKDQLRLRQAAFRIDQSETKAKKDKKIKKRNKDKKKRKKANKRHQKKSG
jgi:hypothetical protein